MPEMPPDEFRRAGRELVDWIAEYFAHPEAVRVSPLVRPGELVDKLPERAPEKGRPPEEIFAEFREKILPHVVHWNHPGFLAYFSAGGSAPGVLAETLSAALNNVGLLWKSSPALAELEQVTMQWLADWLGLPEGWFGSIHTTASTASLHAVIAAREAAREADGAAFDLNKLVMYASEHAHMSIEKAMMALGHGRDACRKIAVDADFRMRPDRLAEAIEADLAAGLRPIAVCATIGTTNTAAVDPLPAIADVCARHGLWLHVDAAYAGPCAMLPEKREHFAGVERADSFLVNPHKWLFTPMDLTAFYTRRPEVFRKALSLTPDYLRSEEDPRAVNYMEYSIPLGRRFRALKLFWVMSYFGREGIVELLRGHNRAAEDLAARIAESADFELAAPVHFSLVCFRYSRAGAESEELDRLNQELVDALNAPGDFFLAPTRLNGRLTIRAAFGNVRCDRSHAARLWERIVAWTPRQSAPS